uniref:Uncharacterized protein n=1 Tax=Oryza nivara TaxID=4536 RepID=A0A0E0IXI5_ORYNI
MASLLRRHPNPLPAAGVPAHLIRRFSMLPDVDHPPLPTSTPTPRLHLTVRGEANLARTHSLVASALSRPDDYPRLHGSRPLFSLAASRLQRLRRLDLAASLLCALLDSARRPPPRQHPPRVLRLHARCPLQRLLSVLLSALFGASRVDNVESTLASAESSFGVVPGRVSYNVLGRVRTARETEERRERRGERKVTWTP